MGSSRKQITTPTFDFGMLLAVGISALPIAVVLLAAGIWGYGFLMMWLASVNLFSAWRAGRCLPDPLPTETRFSLRELLIPKAVTTFALTMVTRVTPPRFGLRLMLLCFVLCAVILSWLKVRDDVRRIDLQGQLAILESMHQGYLWRLEQIENHEPWIDISEPSIVHGYLGMTEREINSTRSQLGRSESK